MGQANNKTNDGIRQGPELSNIFFKFDIFMIYVLLRVIIYI